MSELLLAFYLGGVVGTACLHAADVRRGHVQVGHVLPFALVWPSAPFILLYAWWRDR